MNIILVTILLTLLGTSLVVLLVWLSVVSCRTIKFKKKVKVQLNDIREEMYNNEQSLNTVVNELYKHIEEISNNQYNNLNDYKKEVGLVFEELHKGILNDLSSNLRETRKDIKTLEKNIDSRFDKFHNLIKE